MLHYTTVFVLHTSLLMTKASRVFEIRKPHRVEILPYRRVLCVRVIVIAAVILHACLNGLLLDVVSLTLYVWNSISFPGDYGFEIAFEQQNKDTKSITWTVCICICCGSAMRFAICCLLPMCA